MTLSLRLLLLLAVGVEIAAIGAAVRAGWRLWCEAWEDARRGT